MLGSFLLLSLSISHAYVRTCTKKHPLILPPLSLPVTLKIQTISLVYVCSIMHKTYTHKLMHTLVSFYSLNSNTLSHGRPRGGQEGALDLPLPPPPSPPHLENFALPWKKVCGRSCTLCLYIFREDTRTYTCKGAIQKIRDTFLADFRLTLVIFCDTAQTPQSTLRPCIP
jgi:hypothetical protein